MQYFHSCHFIMKRSCYSVTTYSAWYPEMVTKKKNPSQGSTGSTSIRFFGSDLRRAGFDLPFLYKLKLVQKIVSLSQASVIRR